MSDEFEVKEIPDHEYASGLMKAWDLGDGHVLISMDKPDVKTVKEIKENLSKPPVLCPACKGTMSWTPQGHNCFTCNNYGPDDLCTT